MRKLKKITIQIPLDDRYQDFFEKVEKYELLEIHRLTNDVIIATQLLKFKNPDFSPKQLIGINGIEFIEVISEDKSQNEYICFVKHRWLEDLHELFQETDLIMEPPIMMENDTLTISFIVDNDKIDTLYKDFDRYGDRIKILCVTTKLSPNFGNVLMCLTERQREILFFAIENGYYEIPRKINTNGIAQKFGISQSALSEHLRKIERVVLTSITR